MTSISGVNHRKEEFDYFLFSLPRSTLQNILFRFGYYNNLTFVIPTETGDLNLEILAKFRTGGNALLRARQVNLCPPADAVVEGVKSLIQQWRVSCREASYQENLSCVHRLPRSTENVAG